MLLQLFEVHEEHVRTVLLSHLEAYVEHFTPEQLRTVILPQVRDHLRWGSWSWEAGHEHLECWAARLRKGCGFQKRAQEALRQQLV